MSCGFPLAEFWDATFPEIDLSIAGATERERREHNSRAWQAHTTARLTAYAPDRASKFPNLDKLLVSGTSRPKRQTWQEQLAVVEAMMAAFSERKP